MTRTLHAAACAGALLASALLPAQVNAVSANDSLACTNKCPYFGDIYKGDASFRSSILSSLKRAKIKKLRWFPDGVQTPVTPIKIDDQAYIFTSVCEPHNCPHQFVFLYQPKTKNLVGYYVDENDTVHIIGQPTALESVWIKDRVSEK